MPTEGIESTQSWETAEETVLVNNRGRLVQKSPELPVKSTTVESSPVFSDDDIDATATASLSYDNTNVSYDASVSSKSKHDDGLSSLFNFLFCLGDENSIFEEDRDSVSSPSFERFRKPPRSMTPEERKTKILEMRLKERSKKLLETRAKLDSLQALEQQSREKGNTGSRRLLRRSTSEKSLNLGKMSQRALLRKESPKESKKHSTKKKQGAANQDALLLEKVLKESKKDGSPRRFKPRMSSKQKLKTSDSSVGGLDIVMELQQQEKSSPALLGKNMKKRSKSPKKSRKPGAADGKNAPVNEVLATKALSLQPEVKDNPVTWTNGPALGTYENVSNLKNAMHVEVVNTYMNYRVDKSVIDAVLNTVRCNIPLYHQNDSLTRQASQLSIANSMSTETSSSAKLSSKIKHACSEPVSKSFQVRGPTYLSDGKKIASDETMFSLLGIDSIVKKGDTNYQDCDVSTAPDSYYNKLKRASIKAGLNAPFLIVVNFVVPWGNLLAYFYRPDGPNGKSNSKPRSSISSEKLWNRFLKSDEATRNKLLKFIPRIIEGPYMVKKMVGTQPAMIGQKIPTSYYGSLDAGYLEICMNVTKGGKVANGICSAVAGKASSVTIDLAFLLQGSEDTELPEQLLSVLRLHHVRLKKVVSP